MCVALTTHPPAVNEKPHRIKEAEEEEKEKEEEQSFLSQCASFVGRFTHKGTR